ncbi:hypothetical protein SPBR_04763 [Sporothrix brasiliensis 5110]|uniref:DUF1680 domain containing protein n=1 Tax=Sporothrix brasiliensis 5110 TaxID=1398154 RepID=A0A0C2EMH1_9PEZI|nr:uncharacterized protein SPBR_04763 [Sporothrix brasiliensis 5110]KIH87284.1 hypothetical protein SPBR_04763 [Sporothrix brasiliensis 5110]
MAYPQTSFRNTAFHGPSLLQTRRTTVRTVTLQAQLAMLKSTGRFDAFKLQWHPIYDDTSQWPVPKHLFWDSDCAKWIEAACYGLADTYDAEIDAAVQALVEMIRGAQQPDGYLNIHYTVVAPGRRWTNLRDMHELYNAGHLIEAALAHRAYYKNELLMEPMHKYVRHIHDTFGPDAHKRHGYCGHPEIELALVRMHRATGSQQAYDLAAYFVQERGNPTGQDGRHYYDVEGDERGESPWMRPDPYPVQRAYWYNQAHAPLLQQATIEGHSVRAVYLLTAVADLLVDRPATTTTTTLANVDDWLATVARLWNNMADKKMYLTGGIGAVPAWEGFGRDYVLPQGTDDGGGYAETCASIGAIMLAERLLHLDLDSRYADVLELSLYNVVMTAMDLQGRAFTYDNQLASSAEKPSRREEWFECACCPPNVSRLYGSLGGYLWDFGADGAGAAHVNVHLYTTARLSFDVDGQPLVLEQTSDWPWSGKVTFRLDNPAKAKTTLRLRIPAWAKGQFTLTPNLPGAAVEKGYVVLPPAYLATNTAFALDVHGFRPRFLAPHPYTHQRTLTLARGPLVYCVEDADNPWETNHFKDVAVSADNNVEEEERVDAATGERYIALRTTGYVLTDERAKWADKVPGGLPGMEVERDAEGAGTKAAAKTKRTLVFIPYYYRANRGGHGHMRVGLNAV